MNIISRYSSLEEKFPALKERDQGHPRISALKKYFDSGGVISAIQAGKEWPKLIYPKEDKLETSAKELRSLLNNLRSKKRTWEKKFFSAKIYNVKNSAMKFTDPLYWKHMRKLMTDQDYKADVETVKLPVDMIAEPKYRPMINMFVNDIEYRKQLTETVATSIVYKKDKRVAKYASELRSFRMETSNKNIEVLKKKISVVEQQLKTIEIMKTWVREK